PDAPSMAPELSRPDGPRAGHKPRTLPATTGQSRELNPTGQQEHSSWQADSRTTDLPSWVWPCQMQRETRVTHDRSQLNQMQANPGSGRWLADPKRPCKQGSRFESGGSSSQGPPGEACGCQRLTNSSTRMGVLITTTMMQNLVVVPQFRVAAWAAAHLP